MVEKNNKTSSPVSAPTPFDSVHRIEKTFLGLKYSDALPKDDVEKEAVMKDLRSKYTLTVDFDFSGLTVDEAANALASTTSFMKMLQNNELKHWEEPEALVKCSEPYACSIREMLDNRQTRSISDEEKTRRSIKKMIEKGKTKDEIKALIDSM